MIRLNLMRNRFGAGAPSTSASSEPSSYALDFDSQESFAVRRNRKPLWIALAACLVGGLGVGGWWFYTQTEVPAIPPSSAERADSAAVAAAPAPAPAPAPVADTVKTDSVKPGPVDPALAAAARAESLKVAAQARKDSVAAAKARRDDSIRSAKQHHDDSVKLAKQRREDSVAQAKAVAQAEKDAKSREAAAAKDAASRAAQMPRSVATGVAPAVTAPPLAGGVLDLVLGEVRSTSAAASTSARSFEELAPTARVAYQRFAFEQILNKLRQVTPGNGIGYTRVRILSPGILVIDGEAGSQASLDELVRGLAAQSLLDTSSSFGSNGRFRVTARLPFSASAAAAAPLSASFVTDVQRVIDLASAQGVTLAKSAPQTSSAAPFRRSAWKLSGSGSWDGCARWIASLGGAGSPYGFTSLELSSGADGRLRLQATAIAYGK